MSIKISVRNTSSNPLPEYATAGSAGMDIRASLEAPIEMEPMQRVLVPTGLFMEIPEGYEVQLRPRSGLAIKHGITLLNTPGTIDSDYRGEVKVILINLGQEAFTIQSGDRIAQMIVQPVCHASWHETVELQESARGAGGFGHSGRQ